MTPLISLLLLALGAETNDAQTHYPGASPVFQCTFEASHDEEIYGWPPGWTRRHGPGYPRYVRMRVDNGHPPPGGCSLRVELDGGAATAYGPVVSVHSGVQYVLEGHVETSGLRHDAAYLSLVFLDSARNKLSSAASEKIGGTTAWQKVHLGPLAPPAGASLMLVGLHVEPQGETQDLRGTASFGALWLGQLPRIVLTAQRAAEISSDREQNARNPSEKKPPSGRGANDTTFLLFPRGQPIEITCVASGVTAPAYEIRMQLLDFNGRKLAEHQQSFGNSPLLPGEGQGVRAASLDNSPLSPGAGNSKTEKQNPSPFARTAWRLPGDTVGFYRVQASVVPLPCGAAVPAARAGETPAPQVVLDQSLSLAIIEPQSLPAGSEFGWSLSPQDAEVGLVPLSDLLCQCGVRWVKFPFVVKETDIPAAVESTKEKTENPAKASENSLPEPGGSVGLQPASRSVGLQPASRSVGLQPANPISLADSKAKESAANALETLINFSDRLGQAGVRLAGVLHPPQVAAATAKAPCDLLAAEAFSRDPKTWYPSIEPILARLAVEIRYWQIGDDRDPGWIGCRDLPGIVSRTKTELDRIGQDLDVGIAWNLAAPLPILVDPGPKADRSVSVKTVSLPAAGPNRPKTPWRFLSLACDDASGDEVLAERLEGTKSAGVARWISLATLPREGHAPRQRIAHLVARMLAAKMHGAEAIFVSGPLDSDRGLVARDGSPSELFLPWRTTALMLGGTAYLGPLDLPQGDQIHCFGRKGEYVGVLAGRKPGQETVYLGTELRTLDLWANSRACPPTIDCGAGVSPAPPLASPRSVLTVEQLPTFLVGLDGPITEWQLGVALSPNRLPSVPSAITPVALELKNSFPQAISGRVGIHGPQNWYIEPRTAEFRLAPAAPWKQRLEVALPNDVVGGRQMIQLDFEIQADRLYRFTMFRPLEVTLGDVHFEGQALLDSRGEMAVRQTLINQGKRPAAFRCDLLVPDRRRQSTEVLIQPSGKSEVTYRLADGEQLLGKALWLRAEEIDGPRVLNYRIEAPAASASATPPQETPPSRRPSRPGASVVL